METDAIIILTLAVTGLLDSWLDRLTGRGLIARAEDFTNKLTRYRFARKRG
jgi:hypothetical protein